MTTNEPTRSVGARTDLPSGAQRSGPPPHPPRTPGRGAGRSEAKANPARSAGVFHWRRCEAPPPRRRGEAPKAVTERQLGYPASAGALEQHSRTPVPQPLTYLIDDVARRHGVLRVGAA
ncbi:helicase-associated domain-containing protein, partial [Kitasatospora sp. NPDC048722]|uniref:helicase-associated domain-containing protein n=1 Tax=Kitasatospora sp. NPDC048722 TaxID=3155639 RepID=UPI0033EF5271